MSIGSSTNFLASSFFSHNVSQIVAEYLNWKRSHQHPRSDCVEFRSVVFGFGGHCGVCWLVRFALKDLVYAGRIKQKSKYTRPTSQRCEILHAHAHAHARASLGSLFIHEFLTCTRPHLWKLHLFMPSQVVEREGARAMR